MFRWVRRMGCWFGFHNHIPIREEWFLYKQQEAYLENPDYLKQGENIVTVLFCPHCHDRLEIEVDK